MSWTTEGVLDILHIWNAEKLQDEYQRQPSINSDFEMERSNEKISLETLVAKLDQIDDVKKRDGAVDYAVQDLIARIDAKIAELEAEEAQNTTFKPSKEAKETTVMPTMLTVNSDIQNYSDNGISLKILQECAPKVGFGQEYFREYAKILLTNEFWIKHIYLILDPRYLRPLRHAYVICYNNSRRVNSTRLIKQEISNQIASLVRELEYESDMVHLLKFYMELLMVAMAFEEYTDGFTEDELRKEARSYLFYFLADGLYQAKFKADKVLTYAKKALALSDPRCRQDVFNILGLCAYQVRETQLAYDTYLSWIRQTPIGETKLYWPKGFSFGKQEEIWRRSTKGKKETAIIYNNCAFVSSHIADSYELNSCERKIFNEIALENIQVALNLVDESSYYRTYGLIMEEVGPAIKSSKESLSLYKKAVCAAKRLEDTLLASQYYCDALLDEYMYRLFTSNKIFSEWVLDFQSNEEKKLRLAMDKYEENLEKAKSDTNITEENKNDCWNSFRKLQKTRGITLIDSLALALLLIDQTSKHLMRFLRRNAYSMTRYLPRMSDSEFVDFPERSPGKYIAYYTNLNTVMHLFDVLHRPDKNAAPVPVKKGDDGYGEGVNCLTMMQAYYMNDPYEGLAFERGVSGSNSVDNILFYHGNAWQFREDIFQKNFVFLKSFTDRMDNLLMWNRYGSDRENGSRDSNGCCVRFSPEFFELVNDDADEERNLLVDKGDDYRLYRVVYLNQDGNIDLSKNPELDGNVKICYDHLVELLRYVNSELALIKNNDRVVEAVRHYVQNALNPVIFLFKDDDYAEEQEYRLVVSRPNSDFKNIRMLDGVPEKACINPYFQVCIDKVILGPNVEQPEYWFNHFRYHITEMWRRALGPDGEIPDIIVQKSSIHYHT